MKNRLLNVCICILHVNDTIPRIFVIVTCNSFNFCFQEDNVQCIKKKKKIDLTKISRNVKYETFD